MKCYTIGYANREPDDFIGMLIEHRITHLVDIRRYPQSTFREYDKESLEYLLPKNGILYFHCEGLGGMRDSTYTEYMATDPFRSSFDRLITFMNKINEDAGQIVLMCAEKSPKSCHRQYLSTRLEENGLEVTHLLERGQTNLFYF